MTVGAIYCRVSTEDQEKEGTSLQTQLEACLKYCQDKGYDVAYRFSEAYSGLTLERPKLNELRELVRNEQIDVVAVYCLDRLSRDPTHGVILAQELEKHHVALEGVTETVDSSELGKLISYIRGFASKLEAEKIRERTIRGKIARAKEGHISTGSFSIYGYDYIPVSQKNGGRRVINENEAKWVRQIYQWLVNEGMSSHAIVKRLTKLNVPTKKGGLWCRQSVIAILKNQTYTGKTYAFTTLKGSKKFTKPKEEWIEVPDATPPIISLELFEAAQKQLQINKAKAQRNMKREYLLRGHLRCRQCGHAFVGGIVVKYVNNKRYERRRYRCSGRYNPPFNDCRNRTWTADKLEDLIWQQIEHVLKNPALIMEQIEKQRQDANQLGVLQAELQQVERQLRALDRDQEQLLQWALKGFPEQTVILENKKINTKRETLKAQEAELATQIKASQEATISLPKLGRFVDQIQAKLSALDLETKRQVLDMLGIKIWLAGHNVEITGVIPIEDDVNVTTRS